MFIMNNVLVTPTNISFVFHNYCNYFTAFLIKQQPLNLYPPLLEENTTY